MRQPDVDLESWRRRVRLWAIGFNAVLPRRHPKNRVIEIARVVADDTWHSQTATEARRRALAMSRDYILGATLDSLASKYDTTPRAIEAQIRSHGGKLIYSGTWPDDGIDGNEEDSYDS